MLHAGPAVSDDPAAFGVPATVNGIPAALAGFLCDADICFLPILSSCVNFLIEKSPPTTLHRKLISSVYFTVYSYVAIKIRFVLIFKIATCTVCK
jgi:hypothetical protein